MLCDVLILYYVILISFSSNGAFDELDSSVTLRVSIHFNYTDNDCKLCLCYNVKVTQLLQNGKTSVITSIITGHFGCFQCCPLSRSRYNSYLYLNLIDGFRQE